MNSKKLITFIFAACLMFTSSTWALSFVTEDYPPFNYVSDYGYLSGSSTQIVEEMLKRSKLSAPIKVYPWARAYKMAQDRKDVCVFTTSKTAERERQFKWIGPLGVDSWTLFAKADSPISVSSLNEAMVYKIGAVNEGAQATYLKSNGFQVDTASSEYLNLRKLLLGRFDLWAVGSASGEWLAKTSRIPIKKVITFREVAVFLACNLSVADSDILKMNDAIHSMKADGFIEKVLNLYR